MATIADRLGLHRVTTDADGQKRDITVSGVLGYLNANRGWLLVLDNADDPSLLDGMLPPAGAGKMLFTARPDSVGSVDTRVEIGLVSPEDGAFLFLRRAGALRAGQTLEDATPPDNAAGLELSRKLGCLPLAIDQAGAYAAEVGLSPASFALDYDALRDSVLRRRGLNASGHADPAFDTFWMAYERLEAESQGAAAIFNICAILEPDDIPESIFAPILEDDLAAGYEMVATGQRLRLLRSENNLLSIHRVAQATLLMARGDDERRELADVAINAVSSAFPDAEFTNWHGCEAILPHALACARSIDRYGIENQSAARILIQTSSYLCERARYRRALPLCDRALALCEKTLGPDSLDTAICLNTMATLYHMMGDDPRALPMYRRALDAVEKALGPNHTETAMVLNNLALLNKQIGNFNEALMLYRRALKVVADQLGTESAKSAMILNGLGSAYQAMGNFRRARPLLRCALKIRMQVLGVEHPDTAQSLNNISGLYYDMRDYDRAISWSKRALAARKKVLGLEHPDTGQTLNNLASAYYHIGEYASALPLHEEALAIYQKGLGVDHPLSIFVRTCRDKCIVAMRACETP